MNKEEFSNLLSRELKLIRTEQNLTQEQMAEIIGISKKTLVEIEKGRKNLSWSNSVSVSAIFEDSEIIRMNFGEDIREIIKTLAFETYSPVSESHLLSKTLGGKIWWEDIKSLNSFRIQHNLISKHYRILDDNNIRLMSTFSYETVLNRFNELTGEDND